MTNGFYLLIAAVLPFLVYNDTGNVLTAIAVAAIGWPVAYLAVKD
jgi:energy-converting hydrogenase Eha subunit E